MSLVDELSKLQQLREAGALTEDEFRQAKKQLLGEQRVSQGSAHPSPLLEALNGREDENNTLGQAANRYVSYQYIMSIIGIILFIIIAIFMVKQFSNFTQSAPVWRH